VIGCLECGVDPFSPRVLQDRLGDDIVRIVHAEDALDGTSGPLRVLQMVDV
jgi:hypothetical protein